MKKYLIPLFLIMFIVPSIALASWWKPSTWKIFNKKRPTSQAQVINIEKEKTPEEKISELQKQVDELKNQKTNHSVLTTSKKEIITDKKTQNYNFLVIDLLNSILSTSENYTNLINKFNSNLLDREVASLKFKAEADKMVVSSVAIGVNIPNDMWRALSKASNADAIYARSIITMNNEILKNISPENTKLYIKGVEQKFYTREDAINEMKTLMKIYDSFETYSKSINKNSESFYSNSKMSDENINRALTALQKNADDYAYAKSTRERAYQPVQQIIIPKIELPKTTYCDIRSSGISGSYNVTCNQY